MNYEGEVNMTDDWPTALLGTFTLDLRVQKGSNPLLISTPSPTPLIPLPPKKTYRFLPNAFTVWLQQHV